MRDDLIVRQLEAFCVLLDGRAHPLSDFIHLELSAKTLNRYLRRLERTPDLQVIRFNIKGRIYLKSDYKLKYVKPTLTHKLCNGCPRLGMQPIKNFNKSSNTYDGLQAHCRACQSADNKAYRLTNHQKLKRYKQRRQQRLKKRKENGHISHIVGLDSPNGPTDLDLMPVRGFGRRSDFGLKRQPKKALRA